MPRPLVSARRYRLPFFLLAFLLCANWAVAGQANAKPGFRAPAVQVKTAVVDADGAFRVALRCPARPAGRCAGNLRLRLFGAVTKPVRFDLRKSGKAKVRLALRPAQAKKLRASGKAGAKLVIKVRGTKQAKRVGLRLTMKATPGPDPDPDPDPDPETPDDGLPPKLPAGTPNSDSFENRAWQPTEYDTCPKPVHDRFAVIGPDGKRYPTWHPRTVTDPATGQPCSFGHEHGADPRGSDLFEWVAEHLSSPDSPEFAGLPFGYANEQLVEYAEQPGNDSPKRFEDHVGHKIDYVNDVVLIDDRGRTVEFEGADGKRQPVVCDYLYKLHQGTHSLDATTNNVHELIYATRCNDGTELLSTAFSMFGSPGEFNRSCSPFTKVKTSPTANFPSGGGARKIPDRFCANRDVLVKSSGTSTPWSVYETWESENVLETAEGEEIAYFDPDFAVFNPSRYHFPGNADPQNLGRMLDLSWEITSDGRSVNADPWTRVSAQDPFGYQRPESPFSGAHREFYIEETTVRNQDGPRRWWTDPWGRNGSTQPFPGAICQLIGQTDNSDRPDIGQRLFGGTTRNYGVDGVHAPN